MDTLINNITSVSTMQILIMLISFLAIIPALTLHEWAHGWMANRLGDNTARMLGRLSLNPIRHIDPIGTVLVPIGLLVFSVITIGIPFTFGWAKPVPFNPRNLQNPKGDTALIGLAGPMMNVILAVGTALLLMALKFAMPELILNYNAPTPWGTPSLTAVGVALGLFAYLNLVLCFFNLLPIPPFDGARVVQKFLTGNARVFYARLEQYGMFIILGLIFIPQMLLGVNLIGLYFGLTAQPVFRLLTTIHAGTLFESLRLLLGT